MLKHNLQLDLEVVELPLGDTRGRVDRNVLYSFANAYRRGVAYPVGLRLC
jgi:hypothetical protein